jgi:hypothetical protein
LVHKGRDYRKRDILTFISHQYSTLAIYPLKTQKTLNITGLVGSFMEITLPFGLE